MEETNFDFQSGLRVQTDKNTNKASICWPMLCLGLEGEAAEATYTHRSMQGCGHVDFARSVIASITAPLLRHALLGALPVCDVTAMMSCM